MSNECSSNISVTVDCIFTIRLDSQVGSTGYSWALAHMPDSVNLLDISFETSQSHIVGCSETQVFTFVALTEDVNYITFNLLRAWEPENIADQKKFSITIEKDTDTADELQNTAGCKKFASFGDACSSNGITIMYMSPVQCGCDGVSAPNALYMGPPVMKYMGPPVMKYMGPPVMKYMGPPVIKYMAPVDTKDNNDDSCT
jgi:predicted secreted protein